MAANSASWRIRLGAIGWFIAGLAFVLAVPIVLQASWMALPAILLIATLLALPVAWVWRRFRPSVHLGRAWTKVGIALTICLSVILAAPIYYFASITQLKPALVPQVTLQNGEKEIIFQGMQHVGAERFYKSIVFDLESGLSNGYILYYEGVRPSTADNDAWFAQTVTHGRDLTSAYRELGSLCGLDFQSDYLQVVFQDSVAHPENHSVADVDTAQMKAEFDRLMATDPDFATAMSEADDAPEPDSDSLDGVVSWLQRGTDAQREMAGVICRGFMTSTMTQSNDSTERQPLDPLILDFRNRVLAQRLLDEPRDKIYLTYGAAHFPGVYALLRNDDPRWQVVSVKWLRTIDTPENYSATLPGLDGA
jgi:hypothetical protein